MFFIYFILAQSLPNNKDTKRLQIHRAALEDEITRLDEGIKAYSRTPVSGSETCKQSRRRGGDPKDEFLKEARIRRP